MLFCSKYFVSIKADECCLLSLIWLWLGMTRYCANALQLCSMAPSLAASQESASAVRIRCRVAYDGAGFNGFQYQPGAARTVQGEIEQVLSRRYNRLIRVVGAGRTDAGVHARGHVVHFDLEEEDFIEPPECYLRRLQKSMNSMLMNDIRVWNVGIAPPIALKPSPNEGELLPYSWHAIYDARKKLYSYRISTAPVMDPLLRHNRWHIEDWIKMDLNRLEAILKHYEGTHDFRAFGSDLMDEGGAVDRSLNTVRTVFSVNLIREKNGNSRIDVLLKGALYKMVRNMVGTAIDVCRDRLSEETFLQLLGPDLDGNDSGVEITRATNRCKPAPPQGLTLEMVFYDDEAF